MQGAVTLNSHHIDLVISKYSGFSTRRVNALASGRFQFNFRQVVLKLTLVNGGWGISHEIALRWMPLDLTDDKSTLVQVMAWCRQATSHYLSQCWPRSMSPNGVTRPQWVKLKSHGSIVWFLPISMGIYFALKNKNKTVVSLLYPCRHW